MLADPLIQPTKTEISVHTSLLLLGKQINIHV